MEKPKSYRGKIEISPRLFDLVLPELVEKTVLTIRESHVVQKILREQGPDQAAIHLTRLLERHAA